MSQGVSSDRARGVIQQLSNQGISKLAVTDTKGQTFITLHMTLMSAPKQDPLTLQELVGVM